MSTLKINFQFLPLEEERGFVCFLFLIDHHLPFAL